VNCNGPRYAARSSIRQIPRQSDCCEGDGTRACIISTGPNGCGCANSATPPSHTFNCNICLRRDPEPPAELVHLAYRRMFCQYSLETHCDLFSSVPMACRYYSPSVAQYAQDIWFHGFGPSVGPGCHSMPIIRQDAPVSRSRIHRRTHHCWGHFGLLGPHLGPSSATGYNDLRIVGSNVVELWGHQPVSDMKAPPSSMRT
jgi:hypothetical protein